MANKSGNAYALTVLCPIKLGTPGTPDGMSDLTYADLIRFELQKLRVNEESPMARVPNAYLSRLWVLDDLPYQGHPAVLEHLKSKYLVFSANFHGDLDAFLEGMCANLQPEMGAPNLRRFQRVRQEFPFIYIKKCQVTTTFFFNGSTDESLAEQLKSLYLKQELSTFAFENQGASASDLQAAFKRFEIRTEARNLERPTWKAGAYTLDTVVRP
jgi:hypothetical protein